MSRTVRYYGWEKDCPANGCPTPCRHELVIGNGCPIHRRRDVNGHIRRHVTWTVTTTHSDTTPTDVTQLDLAGMS